jgi:HAL2 family 3'(2'),5'-bisphosphate nucleotidase
MTSSLAVELRVALQAVRKACALCREVQEKLVTGEAIAKRDRSPVTVADYGSQALITLELMRAFPGDPVVGEEESSLLREQAGALERVWDLVSAQGGEAGREEILSALDYGAVSSPDASRFWTLDPIDGTKGFLRKEQYAVALGLVENGEVVLGVLGCPNYAFAPDGSDSRKGCLVYAVKGGGAFWQPLDGGDARQIRVDAVEHASDARFCEPVEEAHADHGLHARISGLLGMNAAPLRMDSQCKYAAVAGGDASVYLRLPRDSSYQETIWDHAAGAIVVEEAGGRVSDIYGNSLDFTAGRLLRRNKGIVATNGRVHRDILSAVSSVLGEAVS